MKLVYKGQTDAEMKAEKKFNRKASLALLVAVTITTVAFGVKELNLSREYKEDVRMIDSTYKAKVDSLKGWYSATLDSLKRAYQARKDSLENLAN